MAVAGALALLLMLVTASFHYAVLRWLSSGMARIAMKATRRVLCIVFVIILAHIAKIVLYAGTYALSAEMLGIGSFGGLAVAEPLDFLYFSIVTYTSLGLGDVFPGGHLRIIAGVEALNGLLLIAWSASFMYLAMGRLWPWERCAEPHRAGD